MGWCWGGGEAGGKREEYSVQTGSRHSKTAKDSHQVHTTGANTGDRQATDKGQIPIDTLETDIRDRR